MIETRKDSNIGLALNLHARDNNEVHKVQTLHFKQNLVQGT